MITWEDVIWEPARTSCRFCSSRKSGEVPAAYDCWYETVGPPVVDDRNAPMCVLLPLCAKCTAEEREAPLDRDMPLIRVRTLDLEADV